MRCFLILKCRCFNVFFDVFVISFKFAYENDNRLILCKTRVPDVIIFCMFIHSINMSVVLTMQVQFDWRRFKFPGKSLTYTISCDHLIYYVYNSSQNNDGQHCTIK